MIRGYTESIIGTMFSGKTEKLISYYKEGVKAGHENLAFKPLLDTRHSDSYIVSHNNREIPAVPVSDSAELQEYVEGYAGMVTSYETLVVYIDEVQFFDNDLTLVIQELNKQGINVVCSGLPIDRFAMPFGAMPEVMAISDQVTRIERPCANCDNYAYVSMGISISGDDQVAIGAEEYKPVCKECFYSYK